MKRPKHHEICARCGSAKAYFSTTDGVVCPVCGFQTIISSVQPPSMTAEAYDALVDHRYGLNTTAALRRKPQTVMEKLFVKTWTGKAYGGVLPVLLANRFNFPNGEMTERDAAVVVQFVRWLGSPMGQHFLYECGFAPAKEIEQ